MSRQDENRKQTDEFQAADIVILRSWPEIIPSLPAIEDSAAQLFKTNPASSFLATEPGLSISDFNRHHESVLLWVAIGPSNSAEQPSVIPSPSTIPNYPSHTAIGFLAASLVDAYLHIVELNVAIGWQGRGAAKRLMIEAEKEARTRGSKGLSLTTSKITPWSFDWYLRLGYREVLDDEAPEALKEIVQQERRNWVDKPEFADSRTVMVKEFEA